MREIDMIGRHPLIYRVYKVLETLTQSYSKIHKQLKISDQDKS